jgi:hypothetical protein
MLITVNSSKSRASELSILMRIMTNYLQLISAAFSFNIRYPTIVSDIFYPIERIGSSSETFVSFDCFVNDYDLKAFTPSSALFKLFLIAILPIFLFVVISLIWILVKYLCRKWCHDLKQHIVVSVICILFLLHPTITKSTLNMFQCIEVDQNERKMKVDPDFG